MNKKIQAGQYQDLITRLYPYQYNITQETNKI